MTNQNFNSSSLQQPVTSSLVYEISRDERLLSVLYRKVETLEKEVVDLKTKKIVDETQLSPELLEENNLLPGPVKKLKRGRGYRPLLQSEIQEAKKHSVFAAGQARWLNVHYTTYKRYAKLYGLFEPKPTEKGRKCPHDPNRGWYPLNKILNGDYNGHPSVTNWMVRDKLIRSGTFKPECNICGYNKRRIGDNKICLLLDHKDGDDKNFKRENLQLLCFNCTFECGRGYIRRGKHMFDPDWIEGAAKPDIREESRW